MEQTCKDKFEEELRTKHQVERGPMWRVTVLLTDDTLDAESKAIGFVHQSHLLFSIHHAIADGQSTVRICGFLTSLLNDVIGGKQIDDTLQLAEFVDGSLTQNVIDKETAFLEKNPMLYSQYKEKLKRYENFRPLFFDLYEGDNSAPEHTITLWDSLPKDITSKFFAKARDFGVTINSAFCCAVHAAFVQLLNVKNCSQEEYTITSSHDISCRRYWDCDTENKFGIHIALHRTTDYVPRDVMNKFWSHAQQFHSRFFDELNNKEAIKSLIVEANESPPPRSVEEFMKESSSLSPFYFGIANIGNVTRFFKKSDGSDHEFARVVGMQRSTEVAPETYSGCINIETLNGVLYICSDVHSRYFSKATATVLLETIIEVIKLQSV